MATLPYKIGIAAAVGSAFISVPMIFDLDTVLWFNEQFVTAGESHPFYMWYVYCFCCANRHS
jgi:hypothetical protein